MDTEKTIFPEKDIIVDYRVTKNSKSPDMEKIILAIINYVQRHEIYFKYEPRFVSGILIFGIVGFQKNQKVFASFLSKKIAKNGGKLTITLKRG